MVAACKLHKNVRAPASSLTNQTAVACVTALTRTRRMSCGDTHAELEALQLGCPRYSLRSKPVMVDCLQVAQECAPASSLTS